MPFAGTVRGVSVHVDGTVPYPWPYDGLVDGASLALVLAGWDECWSARVAAPHLGLAVSAATTLAGEVAAGGGMVVALAHRGAVPLGRPTPSALTVRADGLDGCFGGPLEPELRRRGRTHVIVAGLGLEGPVHSTLRSLNDRGFECLLVTDACAPLDAALGAAAAGIVTMSGGIFGAVGTLAPTLAALTAPTAPTAPTDLAGRASPAPNPSPQEEP